MKKYGIIALLITYLIFTIYLFTPTLNYGFKDLANLLVAFCLILFVIELKKKNRLKIRIGIMPIVFGSFGLIIATKIPVFMFFALIGYTIWEVKNIAKENRIGVSRQILAVVLVYSVVLPFFTSSEMLKSKEYHKLIGTVKTGESFSSKIAPVSPNEIRIIDKQNAERLGDKVLGTIPSMGSQVDVGNYSIQRVNNKLYWVAPLLHSGFFKWQKNKNGTSAYIMVSATNERDVKLVQNYNNQPVVIKYQNNAFFGDKLKRHIYFNGYMRRGYTDYSFEIDDNGKPYWVVTLYKKRIGFSGDDATGCLVVDCQTGEIKEYGLNDAPEWVDRIQPSYFIQDQLDYWGEYVHGFANFSGENKLTTTPGISLVYGNNGRSYWYTGLTSTGADEGTVGFVLVDTRNKEATWYKQVGATENAAQSSAQGKVQEKGYDASFPITYNISGIPTYVMALKDQAGLVKMLAMVSVEDYTIVGVGNNFTETLRSYNTALNSNGNETIVRHDANIEWLRNKVVRIANDLRNGNSVYYLVVKDNEDKIFVAGSAISPELPLTQAGDSIAIRFDNANDKIVDISAFDNLEFVQNNNSK